MMWKESYRLGVPLIDEQHKELFERVGAFVRTLRGPELWEDKLDEVKETLDFMKVYVVEHFDDEEAYHEKVEYPDRANHRKIHASLKRDVYEFEQEFSKDHTNEELVQQFAGRLLAWLINHVVAIDLDLARWVEGSDQA